MTGIRTQDSKSLDLYLRELSTRKPLSREEEIALAKQIRQGNMEARDKLVSANLRFVVRIAREYQHRGLHLADLICAGNIGLITAAERFDETRGYKFISYAVWWIRQAIRSSLTNDPRMIRPPMSRIALLHQILKMSQTLRQPDGSDPDPESIAEKLGVPIEMIQDTLIRGQKVRSLDALLYEDGDLGLLAVLPDHTQRAPDEKVIEDAVCEQIVRVLNTLAPREAEILRLSFGIGDEGPLTLAEIGGRFNLTRERIRQIRNKALNRLRHPKCRALLEPLMETI